MKVNSQRQVLAFESESDVSWRKKRSLTAIQTNKTRHYTRYSDVAVEREFLFSAVHLEMGDENETLGIFFKPFFAYEKWKAKQMKCIIRQIYAQMIVIRS